jgi:hypothetical protein
MHLVSISEVFLAYTCRDLILQNNIRERVHDYVAKITKSKTNYRRRLALN